MPVISGGKFVVLGGASQVGSNIAEQLLAGGAREVVLFDNLALGSMETMQHLLVDPRCSFARGDVLHHDAQLHRGRWCLTIALWNLAGQHPVHVLGLVEKRLLCRLVACLQCFVGLQRLLVPGHVLALELIEDAEHG